MIEPVDKISPALFDLKDLPSSADNFYNSTAFLMNELKALGSQIDREQKAHHKGQQQIKETIA